jgi:hypothetical protein
MQLNRYFGGGGGGGGGKKKKKKKTVLNLKLMDSIEYKPVNSSAPDYLGQNERSKEGDYNIFIFRPSKA